MANNPMFNAGVLDPEACHKIIRAMTVCDAFNLPIVFLVDVPGFMVGRRVEHDRMLHWGMRMMQALQLATTPTLTVCLRKAFGLAWQAMNGSGMVNHGVYAWPGAEIGFMDPEVGVNVAFGTKLAAIADDDEREAERLRLVKEVGEATSPYEAAGTMRIDEIIDPADTRWCWPRTSAASPPGPCPRPRPARSRGGRAADPPGGAASMSPERADFARSRDIDGTGPRPPSPLTAEAVASSGNVFPAARYEEAVRATTAHPKGFVRTSTSVNPAAARRDGSDAGSTGLYVSPS